MTAMKNLLLFLVLVLLSCSKSSRTLDPFPHYLDADVEWITYEGILPSQQGDDVTAELRLLPATPGMDSYYELHEILTVGQPARMSMGTSSRGSYSLLLATPTHQILHVHSRNMVSALILGQQFGYTDRVSKDLFLKSSGEHELVMVDENFNEIDPRYRLFRRSDLFTVEGYFTVDSDTTEYFERNTLKKWPVAQLACYDEAVKNYHAMAKERYEGIYLKALSYTVRQLDRNGKEVDGLVFKRILKMSPAEGTNYNRIP